MKKYNCFRCEGKDTKCGTYVVLDRDYCIWKEVANRDLNSSCRTLETMFKEFIGGKK